MPEEIKYVVFKTKWGYFGLAGTEDRLLRTHLPAKELCEVRYRLLNNLHPAQFDKHFFSAVQEKVTAYFEGEIVNFSCDIPVMLCGFNFFAEQVLRACRDIEFGQTISYLGLAKKVGRPVAVRSVGWAMAKNPLPLIIPCHRVIRSDGKVGGFSASGIKDFKAKLIEHEREALIGRKKD